MMSDREYAMLSAINAARVERGLHALAANAPLATAAERHAQDMAAQDVYKRQVAGDTS